jgi:chromosome segregation protein
VEFILPGDASPAYANRQPGEDYLIDHVKFPQEWAGHVAPPLAGVRVADDPAEMGAPGSRPGTWVTRDGVVYRSGRRLLSYKADPPSSVVLKQRNERRHLEEERQSAEAQYEELENRLAGLHLEFEELDARRAQAEKALHDVLQERREAEGTAAATQRQQRVLEQEIELKEASREHLSAEEAKLDEELDDTRRRQEETERALAEVRQTETPAGVTSDEELAASRMTLSHEVTDLKITAARVRERERVAGHAIERSGPVLERLQRDLAATSYQLAAFRRLMPVCTELLAAMEGLMRVYGGVSQDLALQLKAGEEQAEQHSAGLRELSQAEAELQQELSQASNATTDCEVSVTRLRDQAADQSAHLEKLFERYPEAGLAEEEAAAAEELDEVEAHIERLERRRELIGPVNPLAQQEYEEMLERQEFLTEQRTDLENSLEELSGLIKELTDRIENSFAATFAAVRDHFSDVVATLFPGGEGRLTLTQEDLPEIDADGEVVEDEVEGEGGGASGVTIERRGIEISVKPARKAVRSLSLLSGGERSLVAIAFLFAIFLAKPAPFYILDEVEAALDDVNIDRLLGMLRRYQNRTQFIVITHQKRTMEVADTLYGVSMGADGTSKVLSRKMKRDDSESAAPEPEAASGSADPDDPDELELEESEAMKPAAAHEAEPAAHEAEPAALAG